MSKNFIDKARIFVQAGDGGRGALSFRREKFVPLGGPDGGDGGRGGHIYLVADENMNTLLEFRHHNHYKAQRGDFGRSNRKNGSNGKDTRISVPVGTIVIDDADGRCIADLTCHNMEIMVAKGGRGGRGNVHFLTSERHGPRDHELGEPGDERWLRLELRVVAQVGIIGFPNAGKSTLLSMVTNAQPAIADYPFTTLSPVLGSWEKDFTKVVFADIPGLIEGAAEGAGLGHDFLRHIDRTKVLLHLISLSEVEEDDPLRQYKAIRNELETYSLELGERPEVVAVNKIDLEDKQNALKALEREFAALGKSLCKISCLKNQGIEDLMNSVFTCVKEAPELPAREIAPDKIYEPEDFDIFEEEGPIWVVRGVRVEKAVAMTNMDEDESVARLQRRFVSWGVEDRLTEMGAKSGDTVRIGKKEFNFEPAPVWLDKEDMEYEPEMRPSQAERILQRKESKRSSLAEIAGTRGRGKRKH